MNKFLSFFTIISSSLILFASISIFLATRTGQFSLSKTPKPQEQKILFKDSKGNLKYAKGQCSKDSDCTPSGCSSQICSNDPNIITTCEYSKDFPSTDTYSCGCSKNSCAWYKK